MTVVLFNDILSKDFCTSNSDSLSNAEVASSNNKITGFFKTVLAIANFCFSPPDKAAFF